MYITHWAARTTSKAECGLCTSIVIAQHSKSKTPVRHAVYRCIPGHPSHRAAALQVQACTVADVAVSVCQRYPNTQQPGTSHFLSSKWLKHQAKETIGDVPFDQFLASPHLLEQRRVSNDPRCVLDLAACFVESRDDADDSAFHDIRQVGNAVERHAARPLVHNLDHAEARLADEVV